MGLEPNLSLVNFDAEAARVRVEALPSIESATIRKVYPNSLIVELVEKQPVAIWTVDGVSFAIDGAANTLHLLKHQLKVCHCSLAMVLRMMCRQ